jgi:hypothetical protein
MTTPQFAFLAVTTATALGVTMPLTAAGGVTGGGATLAVEPPPPPQAPRIGTAAMRRGAQRRRFKIFMR